MPSQVSSAAAGITGAKAQHQRTEYERAGICLRPVFTHGAPSSASCPTVGLLLPCGDGARLLSWHGSAPRVSTWTLSGEDAASAVALAPDASVAAIAGRSGLLDILDIHGEGRELRLRKRFRPFERSIAALSEFDASSGLLALATRDGHIRVYDADTADCTHVFRAPNALTAVAFHPKPDVMQLFTGAEDGTVHAFDLATRQRSPVASERHHVGAVVSFCFVDSGRSIVSASRDQTICISRTVDLKRIRLVATKEVLTAVCAAPDEKEKQVVAVGENGILRTWDMSTGLEANDKALNVPLVQPQAQGVADVSGDEITDDDGNEVAVVGMRICEQGKDMAYKVVLALSDHTLLVAQVEQNTKPSIVDLVCGNLEEVYDVEPIPTSNAEDADSSDLVVASNSRALWIMQPPPAAVAKDETWTCAAGLQGHTGVILAIDSITSTKALGGTGSAASAYVASASRDTTARVWRRNRASGVWSCIALAKGHAEAVGGVALSTRTAKGLFYVVTAAADRTLKLWSLDRAVSQAEKADSGEEICTEGVSLSQDIAIDLSAKWTVLAHDKDINAVAVSPDGQIVATGSQDKTLKLWSASKGKLRVTCRGHRRGIWDVTFSNVDKVVATSSGDATVKLWSVQNGTCLRSLEGHLSGVLKTVFITRGTQLASSGADGLVKIWQTRSGECGLTIDAHEDRVWALAAVGDGDRLLSGSADGVVSAWDDCTLQKQEKAAAEREQQALVAQHVNSAIFAKQWVKAARGALELGMPQKLKSAIENLITSAEDADAELTTMVRGLIVEEEEGSAEAHGDGDEDEKNGPKTNKLITQLCLYCRDWNATGGPRSAAVAVRTLQSIFRVWTPAELSDMLSTDKRALVEALVAHAGRHYERICNLTTKVMFMEHILESMKALPEVVERKAKRKREKPVLSGDAKTERKKVKRKKKGHDGIATEY